jgi:hypothetical protein
MIEFTTEQLLAACPHNFVRASISYSDGDLRVDWVFWFKGREMRYSHIFSTKEYHNSNDREGFKMNELKACTRAMKNVPGD